MLRYGSSSGKCDKDHLRHIFDTTMDRGQTRATTDSVVIGVASLRPEQIVGSSFFGRTFFLGAPLNRLTSARITVVRRRNMAQPDNQPACDRRDCTLTSGSQALAHPELKRSR